MTRMTGVKTSEKSHMEYCWCQTHKRQKKKKKYSNKGKEMQIFGNKKDY